jgi:hypothetical protein
MPKVTCPKCGTTIDLENRRNVDYGKIFQALQKGPQSFTHLLKTTGLPRKTLSLRLNYLCASGAISKNGGYSLNGHSSEKLIEETVHAVEAFSGDWKRFARAFSLILLMAVGTASVVSAFITVVPVVTITKSPPVAAIVVSPDTTYYMGSTNTLTFDASTSVTENGKIGTYMWKFGDGENAKGAKVSHTYAKAGNYKVTLLVVDSEGLGNTAETFVPILPIPCDRLYVAAPQDPLKVGDAFTAVIFVENVTDMGAWQFGMSYNSSVLEMVLSTTWVHDAYGNPMQAPSAFVEGPFLKQGGNTYFVVPQDFAVFGGGAIPFHGSCLYGQSQTVSGSGTLAYIRFECIGSGESSLTLTDTFLLNDDSDMIPILSLEAALVRVSP